MKSLTDMAGNLEITTEQVLTILRIVATRAGVQELAEWTVKELEGYRKEDQIPTHRIWPLQITASLHNPRQGFLHSVHVGDFAIGEKHREKATTYNCRDGVGEIERLLSDQGGDDKNRPMGVEHPNLAQLINNGPMIRGGWICTHATAEFSPVHLMAVVNRARQTALKLCLECEEKEITLLYESDESTSKERKAWKETLKQEGTKIIIQSGWDAVRNYFLGL